jgi:zinc protease
MTTFATRSAVALLFLACAQSASAQTVDQVVERCVTALGGRAALGKLKSRAAAGTIVLTTPAGDIAGSITLQNALPNKSRSMIEADLTALGAGKLVLDQRFDGITGYALDTLQGNRDITGNQLDNLRNGSFPHPYLNFKDKGTAATLRGREKLGDRDAFVIVLEPTSGSAVRDYIDAETYLPIQTVIAVDVPQLGMEVEQTSTYSDFRDVDGVKIPFRIEASSSVQNYTIRLSTVEHNVPIDDAVFSKPKP